MIMEKFIKRYFTIKVLPVWTILAFDTLGVILSTLLAFVLRYSFIGILNTAYPLAETTVVVVLVNLLFFKLLRTYSSVLRFSSFQDIIRLFLAQSASFATLCVISLLSGIVGLEFASLSVLFIAYLTSIMLMIMLRVAAKTFFELIHTDRHHAEYVFIYGAREAGVSIGKSLHTTLETNYVLKGFMADEPDLIGKNMMGVKVYDAQSEEVWEKMADFAVSTVIVSPAKMEALKNSDLADRIMAHNLKLMTAPPISEWGGLALKQTQLREIRIEDLLQRSPIQIDMRAVANHLEGKCVLITGAAGSIGSEIMRQVANFNPYKLVLVDQAETPLHDVRLELQDNWRDMTAHTIVADITNQTRMEAIFKEHRPQYVFHAAAYKHVPMMEDNVSEAIQNNVAGTRVIADLALKYGVAKFVMVSTDKAVNPTNVMGCSKRICEIYVQSLARKIKKTGEAKTQFITTRFGNVLGSNGSVIPRFHDQIQKGGPVTVTHPDIIRYFMTIPEACRLVLEAGSMGMGGEIYIFDMGKPVKILDLAKRMISLSGRTDVKIEFTGLRHGEKLYEELLNVKELTKPTHHEKIMIANVREYDYNDVCVQIDELVKSSYTYDAMQTVAWMKRIVPEFISKNSCFEALDSK